MNKVVFIDRDGVINVDLIGDYVKTWKEFRFEDGALKALQQIVQKGYKIIIISNQAGVGDGIFTEDALVEIHSKMIKKLKQSNVPIFATHYCLHGKDEGCSCRKPEVGLFVKAAWDLHLDRSKTYFIGDKATDIEAGKRFGLKTIFVMTGHGKNDFPKLEDIHKPNAVAENLLAAVKYLK